MTEAPSESLTTLMFALSSAMREAEPVQARLASLNEEIADIRQRLHALMETSGTKTVEAHGLMAVRSRRKSAMLTDENALRSFLSAEGLDGAYMRLDMVSARKDAVKHGWPGVEEKVNDVLSVKNGGAK